MISSQNWKLFSLATLEFKVRGGSEVRQERKQAARSEAMWRNVSVTQRESDKSLVLSREVMSGVQPAKLYGLPISLSLSSSPHTEAERISALPALWTMTSHVPIRFAEAAGDGSGRCPKDSHDGKWDAKKSTQVRSLDPCGK